jgi:hypothetical protein
MGLRRPTHMDENRPRRSIFEGEGSGTTLSTLSCQFSFQSTENNLAPDSGTVELNGVVQPSGFYKVTLRCYAHFGSGCAGSGSGGCQFPALDIGTPSQEYG